MKNYGTVKEAADHFGVSRQRIHQLMQKGLLGECKKVRPRGIAGMFIWLIPIPFNRVDKQQKKG